MGLNVASARFLMAALDLGVSYEQTLTIGRPFIRANLKQLNRLLHSRRNRLSIPPGFRITAHDIFADRFFGILGASHLDALDFSAYEGANILHDMNEPIPENLKHRYTVVYDTGSLEHIFNFPVAIKNCMELVAPGGHIILGSPANNWCGHGFYQFSPELFSRIFVPQNGFELKKLVLKAADQYPFYSVVPPGVAGERVCLINGAPTELFALAKRVDCSLLGKQPVQMMYEQSWAGTLASSARESSPLRVLLTSGVVQRALRVVNPSLIEYGRMLYLRYTKESFRNRSFYQRESI